MMEPAHPAHPASGQHTVEARFEKMAAGTVHLVTAEGEPLAIHREDLSPADRDWLEDWAAGRITEDAGE